MRRRGFLNWYWNGTPKGRTPWLRRLVGVVLALTVVLPIVLILLFRFVPVPFTPQFAIDFVSGQPVHYAWRGSSKISPMLARAVIAAEDQNFCRHNGFDWDAIEKAFHNNTRGGKLRGGSTISQQTARSLFLTPARTWLRKGTEAYLTVLLEFFWPKERILLAYLNLVDWGHGNYGAEAAAQSYFDTSARDLSRYQAARLAAILPSPDKWRADRPGPYVVQRTETLMARSRQVQRDNLDFCVRD